MSDITPVELAVVRALVLDDWDRGVEYTDLGSRDTVVHLARAALAAARPHVESDLLRSLAAELRESRAIGGIEYVDATWLESRAEQITRGGDRG
ncbi:MAG: hypothetical protein HOQ43_10795 [Glycomyces artemisiae]|uniref:Uncharacterized protein n=1 Tax=Glycomyces artemisiae TaxID=1076443 RepID=A0A850C9M2_9ACTN|nr:hypothetical protein [Glycomyces artemisiae]